MTIQRSMARLAWLPILLVPMAVTAQTPAELDRKVLAQARTGSEIMANLTYLCDEIGPRLSGSANLKRASEWTAERMKSYGLSNVHLEAWSIPVGWERGPATARIIEPDDGCRLTIASQANCPRHTTTRTRSSSSSSRSR